MSLGARLVPMIAVEEGVSLSTAQWTVTGSFVVAGVTAPLLGRLGVGHRLRPVLVVTLIIGVVGALLVALPLGIKGILVGRALQGFAYAVTPLLFAVARTLLPEGGIASGLSTLSVANVVAAGLGFPLVSFVAASAGLSGAYWFGFALMVLALVAGVVVVPPSTEISSTGLDVVGALLLGGGVLAVLLTVSRGAVWGWASPRTVVVGALGAVLVLAALWWFGQVADPLIDFRLARVPVVLGAHLAALLVGIGTCPDGHGADPRAEPHGQWLRDGSLGGVRRPDADSVLHPQRRGESDRSASRASVGP